jgi:hypothetical protein
MQNHVYRINVDAGIHMNLYLASLRSHITLQKGA